jgi:hypothetical protein
MAGSAGNFLLNIINDLPAGTKQTENKVSIPSSGTMG